MKRMIALLISAAMLLSLAACNSGGEVASSDAASETVSKYVHDVDVMSYVKDGTIPELPVSLGAYMSEVKTEYGYADTAASASAESSESSDDTVSEEVSQFTDEDALDFVQHEEEFEMILEEEYLQVTANTGDAYYLYKTRYEGYGISKIACMKNCYGFTVGATLKQDIIDGVNVEAVLIDEVSAESVDFLPGAASSGFTAVSYTSGDYTLTFYFLDDFLSFTTIQDDRYWYENDEE